MLLRRDSGVAQNNLREAFRSPSARLISTGPESDLARRRPSTHRHSLPQWLPRRRLKRGPGPANDPCMSSGLFPPLRAGAPETPPSPLRAQSHLPGGGYVGLRPATATAATTFQPPVFDITVPDLTGQEQVSTLPPCQMVTCCLSDTSPSSSLLDLCECKRVADVDSRRGEACTSPPGPWTHIAIDTNALTAHA